MLISILIRGWNEGLDETKTPFIYFVLTFIIKLKSLNYFMGREDPEAPDSSATQEITLSKSTLSGRPANGLLASRALVYAYKRMIVQPVQCGHVVNTLTS